MLCNNHLEGYSLLLYILEKFFVMNEVRSFGMQLWTCDVGIDCSELTDRIFPLRHFIDILRKKYSFVAFSQGIDSKSREIGNRKTIVFRYNVFSNTFL